MTTVYTPLDLRAMPGGAWQLQKPFRVTVDALNGRQVSVPKGFLTDLASVPRLHFVYWSVGGRGRRAATIHDYLYQTHADQVSRSDADRAFYEVLTRAEPGGDGEGVAVAWAMWLGVRAGGMWAWHTGPRRFRAFQNQRHERRREILRA